MRISACHWARLLFFVTFSLLLHPLQTLEEKEAPASLEKRDPVKSSCENLHAQAVRPVFSCKKSARAKLLHADWALESFCHCLFPSPRT